GDVGIIDECEDDAARDRRKQEEGKYRAIAITLSDHPAEAKQNGGIHGEMEQAAMKQRMAHEHRDRLEGEQGLGSMEERCREGAGGIDPEPQHAIAADAEIAGLADEFGRRHELDRK